uniref:FGLa-related allatostatin n=1 Tax=Nilaparvata lugens TaxID=108931 RepID=U3U9Y0_NILLU|nr:FGLa-related allatostatin [Nilaparvata lugens]
MREQRCCFRMVAAAVPLMLAMVMEMGARAAAMEAFSEKDLDNYYKRMYDFGLGKRAYVYSANKRPMYDFGIGKRDNNRQRMYAFGLGKRAEETPEDESPTGLHTLPWKRALKAYEFGLGKRAAAPQKLYSFGLGKRGAYSDEEDEDDSDVMEKRSR